MSKLREEFILRALEPDVNLSELRREYEISRKTVYKCLQRFKEGVSRAFASAPSVLTARP